MRSRTPASALSGSDQQFEVGRQAEAVDEPLGKSAEDPSLANGGQGTGDPRFELRDSSPAMEEDSGKAAEDPSAANW